PHHRAGIGAGERVFDRAVTGVIGLKDLACGAIGSHVSLQVAGGRAVDMPDQTDPRPILQEGRAAKGKDVGAIQLAGTDETGRLVVIPCGWSEEGVGTSGGSVDLARERIRGYEVRVGDTRCRMTRLLAEVELQGIVPGAATRELEPALTNQRVDAGERERSGLRIPAVFLHGGVKSVSSEIGDGRAACDGLVDVRIATGRERRLNGSIRRRLVEVAS